MKAKKSIGMKKGAKKSVMMKGMKKVSKKGKK